MNNDYLECEFGCLEIEADDLGVTSVSRISELGDANPNAFTDQCVQELKEYFSNKRRSFDVPLNLQSNSEFYKKVWSELLRIPYGKTISYLDIAIALGDRNAIRAVGTANGKNPIAIIVPCHRVIGSNGSLTGYAGGLDMKRGLLALENPKQWAINGSLF